MAKRLRAASLENLHPIGGLEVQDHDCQAEATGRGGGRAEPGGAVGGGLRDGAAVATACWSPPSARLRPLVIPFNFSPSRARQAALCAADPTRPILAGARARTGAGLGKGRAPQATAEMKRRRYLEPAERNNETQRDCWAARHWHSKRILLAPDEALLPLWTSFDSSSTWPGRRGHRRPLAAT